jgi:chemotaxis response regulator CheB
MKRAAAVALCTFLLTGQAQAQFMCFTEKDANNILKELEAHEIMGAQIADCESSVEACEAVLGVCKDSLEVKQHDIDEIMRERDEALQMIKDAQRAATLAKKGSWWDRLKRDSKAVAIGAAIGGAVVLYLFRK